MFGEVELHKYRDNEKQEACKCLGLTLLEIPYWWKRDLESIIEMLHKHRPDTLELYR